VAQWVRLLDYLTIHLSLSQIRRGFTPGFVNDKKGCTRLAAASDKVYQLLVHGRWFSPGTPASSTTKTGRHDIAEILLKVPLNTINQINQIYLKVTLFLSRHGKYHMNLTSFKRSPVLKDHCLSVPKLTKVWLYLEI